MPDSILLTTVREIRQLVVTATFADRSTRDVSAAGTETNYRSSNPAIATVTAGGLVSAVSSGTVVIQASNDGTPAIQRVRVVFSNGGSDGDGIPDDYEVAHGLDPNNPVDAQIDPDRDGLTNLQEYQLGSDPQKADTDGDGLSDGDEVNVSHTDPLVADTDGDGISYGLEVRTGSDPLDRNSTTGYAERPLYPLAKTVAVLNLDALNVHGRTRDLTIIGLGLSDLDDVVRDAAAVQGRIVKPDPMPEKGSYFRSDHFPFARKGVPSIHAGGGIEFVGKPPDYGTRVLQEYIRNDYHKPSDAVKPDWDLSGAVEDLDLYLRAGYALASGSSWPAWKPGAEWKARRDEMMKAAEAR